VSTGTLFSVLQTSLFLNHVLPLKGGEVARPLLGARHGVPLADAVSTTVLCRLLDFLSLVILAVALVPAVRGTGSMAFPVLFMGTLVTGALAALLVLRWRVPQWTPSIALTRTARVHAVLQALRPWRVALALPVVLVSWVLEGAVLYGAAQLLGVEISVRVAVGATAFTILFQVLHFTPGGLGVYEAAMTAALAGQGVASDEALALAVLTHVMKFAYSFTVGAGFAAGEMVALLRGRRGHAPMRASRFEIVMARLWNVLNEGKPFTPVFTLCILLVLSSPRVTDADYWLHALVALLCVSPFVLVFWRFDFPLHLRWALWVYLLSFIVLFQFFHLSSVLLIAGLYLGFTVLLWGTVYYHLRIGTPWTNGFRFVRLVAENPDPTSGNLLEQLPKVTLLVLMFQNVAGNPSFEMVAATEVFVLVVAVSALLLHQWLFTWVPALPQPRMLLRPPKPEPRVSRRVIAIVIDGCRADRLREAHTPFIDRLRAEGTDFVDMVTVYPARTVTCFSSMLTGASPAVHGMHSNFVPNLGVKCDSVFDALRRAGMKGKLVGIAHLIDAFGEENVRSVTAVMHNDEIDDALVSRAKQVLDEKDPDLLVLQLLSVDQTGHARGSYNAEYLRKIEETDRTIEAFLGWCESRGYLEDATVIITADHGQGIGIGGHGHMSPPERQIPCILAGAGVPQGLVVREQRFITDIAPTIAGLLGLAPPNDSSGRELLPVQSREATEQPVAFIIPAHNEEQSIGRLLARIHESGVVDRAVIVVDDGSCDGTAAVAGSMGAIVVRHERNLGLGAALRTGLAVARGLEPRAAVYLDADGEYDPREAMVLLAPIERGEADYVLGSRFRGAVHGMTWSRRMANRCFSIALSVAAGRWISDGQTGYRAFSRRALDVAEIIHDYNYAQVLTLDLLHKGMRMVEVPITYRRRGRGRSFISSAYLWRVPAGMVREMLSQ
jgi:uncharacterized membrane protein YbhN (UPF0104 family)